MSRKYSWLIAIIHKRFYEQLQWKGIIPVQNFSHNIKKQLIVLRDQSIVLFSMLKNMEKIHMTIYCSVASIDCGV